ncbi:uncharacterized protein LOC121381693 [Gigantopelta aegis]|uniref:uncharacterized protein LOC121381693 n=1 Tax=Gigantopelta aegis TaxID=1735272 RepID=UPI001B889857|nr:uncharacterized protein LOC121381693 [Gigantopelta aegis]
MDFLALEPSKGGQQYVLVVTDHFTRYAQAYPSKNMSAKTTAELFFNNFVVHYGLPKRIHSDKGANFVGKLMTELCNLLNIDKSSTTPYHPMGNGMCERFNRTLCDMLGTLDSNSKKDWKTHIGPLVHAYNCTRHETIGWSPYFLMFGRHPRLPVDLAFGLDIEPSKPRSVLKYTKSLQNRLKSAYNLPAEQVKRSQSRQKKYYDHKARAAILSIADRVLVKVVAFDGRHKLADKWEDDVYVILDQPNPSIPVFVVGKENGEGRKRTLHRNLLLPIGAILGHDLPTPKPRRNIQNPTPVPRTRQRRQTHFSGSESEDEEFILIPVASSGYPSDSAAHSADGPSEDNDNDDHKEDEDHNDDHKEDEDDDDDDEVEQDTEEGSDENSSEDEQEELSSNPNISDQTSLKTVNPTDVLDELPEPDPVELDETSRHSLSPPSPAPRRSNRDRRKPRWMTSEDYVMSATVQQDWVARADYVTSLISQGLLPNENCGT